MRVPIKRRLTFVAFAVAVALVATLPASAEPGPDEPPISSPDTTVPVETTVTSTPSGSTIPGQTTTTSNRPPVTAGPGGFGGPPVDPDAPPEPPMPDPSPEIRVLLAQLRLQSQQERLDVQLEKLASIKRAQDGVAKTVDAARAAQADAESQVRASTRRLRSDALAYYVNPGQSGIEKLVAEAPEEQTTRTVLIGVSIKLELGVRQDAMDLVKKRKKQVGDRLDDFARAQARTAAQQEAVDASTRSRDAKASELARARGLSPDWALPIAGTSVFTAEELAQWFTQRAQRSRAQAPVEKLAAAYIDEGRDEHIRGDMAFAQSVLETGSFQNDDTIRLNNFAGIGHCDTCETGFSFPSPEMGVRAQIQLLRDYTQANPKLSHPLVDRRLRGPSGCCQDWTELTSTWATNTNYGPKILGVYREMLYWLVQQRGMTPQVS